MPRSVCLFFCFFFVVVVVVFFVCMFVCLFVCLFVVVFLFCFFFVFVFLFVCCFFCCCFFFFFFLRSANQITWSGMLIWIHIRNGKQCRSRSVGFFRSQLIWVYIVCKGRVYPDSAGQGLILFQNRRSRSKQCIHADWSEPLRFPCNLCSRQCFYIQIAKTRLIWVFVFGMFINSPLRSPLPLPPPPPSRHPPHPSPVFPCISHSFSGKIKIFSGVPNYVVQFL